MKKQLKSVAIFLSVLMLVGSLFGCASNTSTANSGKSGGKAGDKVTVGIIQFTAHVALDSAREGFIAALQDNNFVEGQNLEIDFQNAQADQSNLSTISDRFVSNKVDLVLAIATPAAQAIAGKTKDIPILGTAITDYEGAKLVDSNEKPGGNVTGTSDMNPIKEQIDLLVKLVPDAKTVGVLYTSNEDNSIIQARIAKEAIENLGLNYVEVTVTNSNDVQQAAQTIVEKCDAIYVPTDNVFASSMPIVHGVTIASKTPVIAGESGMVENGALATLGINYYDLGYQTGLMAVDVLTGKSKPADMPIKTSEQFDFMINGTVAEEIGLAIPDDLKEFVITK